MAEIELQGVSAALQQETAQDKHMQVTLEFTLTVESDSCVHKNTKYQLKCLSRAPKTLVVALHTLEA